MISCLVISTLGKLVPNQMTAEPLVRRAFFTETVRYGFSSIPHNGLENVYEWGRKPGPGEKSRSVYRGGTSFQLSKRLDNIYAISLGGCHTHVCSRIITEPMDNHSKVSLQVHFQWKRFCLRWRVFLRIHKSTARKIKAATKLPFQKGSKNHVYTNCL